MFIFFFCVFIISYLFVESFCFYFFPIDLQSSWEFFPKIDYFSGDFDFISLYINFNIKQNFSFYDDLFLTSFNAEFCEFKFLKRD
jgi:hypothetical protein